ncbi:uncharacterized protein LOC143883512 [Tasmannia lanceolata]|uniref:uncharacterized protein LOC143883512 n=1 Tax=Tasmannia lanceolata TaxID=3420 RepID=UPI0040640419
MGLHSCNINGSLDDSKYSKPLPWIGLYIAGASLVCSFVMAMDTFFGFYRRKLWFPCKFSSLNATSLTVLAIATKLPVDLNTSMPRREDQLTKLSSTVLICTVMGNFIPSLGRMEDSEILSNLIAMGIFVITVIVNVGIQMGTGVIYVFLPEHAVIMFFMLVLLVILSSSALTVSATKDFLEKEYDQIHREQQAPSIKEANEIKKLEEDVKRFWIMAHTCDPQFVLGRSATCTASGAFCLLSALILIEAVLRSYITGSLRFCSDESDYKWSITLVLIAQGFAVLVGTIAPACRWFNAISFRNPEKGIWCNKDEFRVESYWVQRLVEWKENPLPYRISSRECRKIAYASRTLILDVCIGMQKVVVSTSKFIRLLSVLPVSCLIKLLSIGSTLSEHESNPDLTKCVLQLEGEEDLVHLIMRKGSEATNQWIHRGIKNQPTYLIELLKKSTQDFKGVGQFDSNCIQSIVFEEPPNCWSLTVVTLTSIAVALSSNNQVMIKSLLRGVNEGLRYVKLIEKHLDAKGLVNMRNAADIVWLQLDLHDCWLNEDLRKLAHEYESTKNVIEKLANIGMKHVEEFKSSGRQKENTLEWPVEVLAANSMYRLAQTTLKDYNNELGAVELLEWIVITISDILGACLTNLPSVISMECFCSAIEIREASVRKATYLLGECRTVLSDLEGKTLVDPKCMADIDKWRSIKQNNNVPLCSPSASLTDMSSSSSCALCLSIE